MPLKQRVKTRQQLSQAHDALNRTAVLITQALEPYNEYYQWSKDIETLFIQLISQADDLIKQAHDSI